uniref:F-box/LRR-repeat protein n=1 Tax=Heterorhabditis bacteriophora TaxID=37862 RepID=A0A1I7W855_HETBA
MAVVNVAQCYLAKNQITPCCRRKEMKANSSMLVLYYLQDFYLLFKQSCLYSCNLLRNYRSIKEYPEIVNLQTSYADIREVKTVSKQLKRLIERNWRRAFFIQIKILSEVKFFWKSPYPTLAATLENLSLTLITFKTHMNAADIRRMKLVSRTLCTSNIEPTFKRFSAGTSVNRTHRLNVSLEDFSRISARCHFFRISLIQVHIFFVNFETQYGSFLVIRKMNVFSDEEKITIVDRLLGATEASYLSIIKRNSTEFPLIINCLDLKCLILDGYCDFSDDDLSAADYKCLHLGRCCLSEHALRRLLKDSLEGRRDIDCC